MGSKKVGMERSPFYQPSSFVFSKKQNLLNRLDKLRMPVTIQKTEFECCQACHIIERNHTIEVLKEVINREL